MPGRSQFSAVSYPLHLYSGADALEYLPRELNRKSAQRALVLCGRSVATRTNLIARIHKIIDGNLAGVFDGIQKDAPLDCVMCVVDAARQCNADVLIAVGAGSVLKAARIVAILLAETRPMEQLITQYPPGGRAISPKLLAPKLPIINVLTAPTTAQNRAGAALKESASRQRMEFFDPKTRPCAVFWDADALLTAPASLALNTGTSIYWRSLMNIGLAASANPLVQGERHQAFRLASTAIHHVTEANNAEARIDLCAAAFLQNREEDEGKRLTESHWVARVVYALGASTFHLCERVEQGAAYAALTGTMMRHFGVRDPGAMAAIGQALGLGEAPSVAQVADAIDACFARLGCARRLRELGVPREMLPAIVSHSLQNFNADANREFLNETENLAQALDEAW